MKETNEIVFMMLEHVIEQSYEKDADINELFETVLSIEDNLISQNINVPYFLYAVKENILNNWKVRVEII